MLIIIPYMEHMGLEHWVPPAKLSQSPRKVPLGHKGPASAEDGDGRFTIPRHANTF